MVNTGVLLREINERIIQVGKSDGALAQRVCGPFPDRKAHPREADIGVRAKKEHPADLLVEDLTADNGKLRSDVRSRSRKLAKDGVLAGGRRVPAANARGQREWDREFRNRQTKLNNDDAAVQFQRDQLLYSETDKIVRAVKLIQGAAKEPRQFLISRDATPPDTDGASIPCGSRMAGRPPRSRWSMPRVPLARRARSSTSSSRASRPKTCAPDRRGRGGTTDPRRQRHPHGDEGREARQSMDSRYAKAAGERDRLVREIVANAKVFQGGGNELIRLTLEERIRDGAADSVGPSVPALRDADSGAWEAAIKRARDGADQTVPARRPCRCDGEASGLHAGDLSDRCRQDRRRNPQGLCAHRPMVSRRTRSTRH